MDTPAIGQDEESSNARTVIPEEPGSAVATVLQASLGGGAVLFSAARWATASGRRAARPLEAAVDPIARFVMRPPAVPTAVTFEAARNHLVARGGQVRKGAEGALDGISRDLLPRLVDAVLERVHVTDLVLRRVDLVRLIEEVLDQIDVTELLLQRVDLDRLLLSADLDAAAARVDVDALVARLDVVALAGSLIDAADVSQAIRASTGSLASGAVRGARVQGAQTYGQVQRVVDRVPLLRREQEPEADPESQTAP